VTVRARWRKITYRPYSPDPEKCDKYATSCGLPL